MRDAAASLTTQFRDILYYGNLEAGDRIKATLMAEHREPSSLTHWFEITRCDGTALASVISERRRKAL